MSAYKDKNQKPVFYYKYLLNEDYKSSKPMIIPPRKKIRTKQEPSNLTKFLNFLGIK